MLGHGGALGTGAVIGQGVRTGPSVWLTSWTTVEDDVRIGAGVTTMNDDTMARLEPGAGLRGPTLRRGCRIAAAVMLTPASSSARTPSSRPARWSHATCRPERAWAGDPARLVG